MEIDAEGAGVRVGLVQRLKAEAGFDGGYSVWLLVIDKSLLGKWGNHNGRDPSAIPPLIAGRRAELVPSAAVIIVGNDDGGMDPLRSILNGMDDVGGDLLALKEISGTG
jgi:hypothetical protein